MTEQTEKTINVNKWKIGDEKYFISYTATWCGPCQRVKPHLLEYMKDFEHLDYEEIKKSEFKNGIGQYVPLFKIINDDKVVDEMQNSDFTVLKPFLDSHLKSFEVNDDF